MIGPNHISFSEVRTEDSRVVTVIADAEVSVSAHVVEKVLQEAGPGMRRLLARRLLRKIYGDVDDVLAAVAAVLRPLSFPLMPNGDVSRIETVLRRVEALRAQINDPSQSTLTDNGSGTTITP